MAFTECRYCEHRNPPESKYCNACGATLTLAPCPRCGAAVDVTAATCYQCHGGIQQSKELALSGADQARAQSKREIRSNLRIDKLENALVLKKVDDQRDLEGSKDLTKPAEATRAKAHLDRKRISLAALATVIFAVSAIIGYQVYRHDPLVSPPSASTESVQPKIDSSAVEQTPAPEPVASTPEPAESDPEPVAPAKESLASTEDPLPAPAIPVGAAEASGEPPCAEGFVALGFCTTQQLQKSQSTAHAAAPLGIAHPQGRDGGEPCKAAAAALALCTPTSKKE
jgi:Double zinc ribbon